MVSLFCLALARSSRACASVYCPRPEAGVGEAIAAVFAFALRLALAAIFAFAFVLAFSHAAIPTAEHMIAVNKRANKRVVFISSSNVDKKNRQHHRLLTILPVKYQPAISSPISSTASPTFLLALPSRSCTLPSTRSWLPRSCRSRLPESLPSFSFAEPLTCLPLPFRDRK